MSRKLTDASLGSLASLLGLNPSGDLGDFTIYTTRKGRVVWYPRAPPKDPPSRRQIRQRARFATAVTSFKALTPAIRNQWEELAQLLGLIATGQNLWIHLSLTQERSYWETAVRRTGTTLTPPEYIE